MIKEIIAEVDVSVDEFRTEELIDGLRVRTLKESEVDKIIAVVRSYKFFKKYEKDMNDKNFDSFDDLQKYEHYEKVKDKYTLAEFYERLPE
jgi:hypothetical protein